jgi:hypothetical protein|tara:strand:+ start:61 stop:663 length:603 start_codon:yes stop_codon:yes gene_type:complete
MSKTQIATGGIADDAVSEEHLDATAITGTTALAETPASTDELLISDGGTLKRLDFTHIFNVPSFRATMGSNQDIAASYTKLAFNTETYDTAGAFDHSSNYRFTVPTGQTGKYLFNVFLSQDGTSAQGANYHVVWYKNGSATHYHNANPTYGGNVSRFRVASTIVASLSADDYIEVYCNGSSGNFTVQAGTEFSGFKLIGV